MFNREMLKNFVLVSLFALCLALTGSILFDVSTSNTVQTSLIKDTKLNVITNAQSVISPQSYLVSFGGGLHTGVFSYDVREIMWQEVSVNLKIYFQTGIYSEITPDEWTQAVNSRSFRIKMPFSYSLENMYQIFGVPVKKDEVANRKVDTIILPTSENDRIYLGDESTGIFYVLKGADRGNSYKISSLINNIELSDITEYKRLEDIFSLRQFVLTQEDVTFVENSNLAPITELERIPSVMVLKEITTVDKLDDDIDLRLYAVNAFGSDFDFVKKVRDIDDSIIYMYGYGEKALRLGNDGSIEYKEKLSGVSTVKNSFIIDLNLAIQAARSFGESIQSMYLSGYEEVTNEKSVKRTFYFNYRIKDLSIYTTGEKLGNAFKIEVIDGEVTLITKNIRKYIKTLEVDFVKKVYSVDEVIEKNSDLILKNYIRDNALVFDSEKQYDYVYNFLQGITDIDMVYFLDSKSDSSELIPAWKIIIDDTLYCFSLYDGVPLNVEKIGK